MSEKDIQMDVQEVSTKLREHTLGRKGFNVRQP